MVAATTRCWSRCAWLKEKLLVFSTSDTASVAACLAGTPALAQLTCVVRRHDRRRGWMKGGGGLLLLLLRDRDGEQWAFDSLTAAAGLLARLITCTVPKSQRCRAQRKHNRAPTPLEMPMPAARIRLPRGSTRTAAPRRKSSMAGKVAAAAAAATGRRVLGALDIVTDLSSRL